MGDVDVHEATRGAAIDECVEYMVIEDDEELVRDVGRNVYPGRGARWIEIILVLQRRRCALPIPSLAIWNRLVPRHGGLTCLDVLTITTFVPTTTLICLVLVRTVRFDVSGLATLIACESIG